MSQTGEAALAGYYPVRLYFDDKMELELRYGELWPEVITRLIARHVEDLRRSANTTREITNDQR